MRHTDSHMFVRLMMLLCIADSSGSFAVVNCADYPDLCQDYAIIHYPTVLLFKASPTDWVPYDGMMDSRRLLKVLEDTSEEKKGLVSYKYIHALCMSLHMVHMP